VKSVPSASITEFNYYTWFQSAWRVNIIYTCTLLDLRGLITRGRRSMGRGWGLTI
jgi:hypothetical protein